MTVIGVKDKRPTVVAVETESKSMLSAPSLTHGKEMPMGGVATLGVLQIMVGLVNIGLGPGRMSNHPGDLVDLGAAYWLGAVFIIVGLLSISAGHNPSSCLTFSIVFMNIFGAIFAITAIVLYTEDLARTSFYSMCDWGSSRFYDVDQGYRGRFSADDRRDNCRNVAAYAQALLTCMDVTLIIMALLHLGVCIKVTVLGLEIFKDDEEHQPLMEEGPVTGPGA